MRATMDAAFAAIREEFLVEIAGDPAVLREAYQLRHEVYCQERGYETASGDIETDRYDRHAHHVVVRHRASSRAVGTVRLVLPSPGEIRRRQPPDAGGLPPACRFRAAAARDGRDIALRSAPDATRDEPSVTTPAAPQLDAGHRAADHDPPPHSPVCSGRTQPVSAVALLWDPLPPGGIARRAPRHPATGIPPGGRTPRRHPQRTAWAVGLHYRRWPPGEPPGASGAGAADLTGRRRHGSGPKPETTPQLTL